RCAFLSDRAQDQEAVRSNRRQKPRVARTVDRTTTVAPHHHGQRVLLRKRVKRRRAKDEMAGRVERAFGRDLVRSRLRERRAFERQCPRDHLASDAGRLRETYAGTCEQHYGYSNDGLTHESVSFC